VGFSERMNVSCSEVKKNSSTPGGFMEKMRKIFISDYGGTITDKDFYSLLAERYIPTDIPDYFTTAGKVGSLISKQCPAYFRFAPTKEQHLEELVAVSQADPDLGASALRAAEVVAFAGDGPPDLEPALRVRPDLRFARGLAEALRVRGEAFQPFSQ
jgi:2-hydroxy-3-keto-5-methylthiopentenyl-1-phosphate phosphatase